MSGFDEYVKTGLIEKESEFEIWYKTNQNDIEDEYQEYVAETKRLSEKPMDKKKWAKEIFESQTVMETMDVPTKHQLNVAMKTIKTPAAMLGVMGGMTYKDAVAFFRKIKYSDDKIRKLLASAGHKENEIKDLMENVGEPEIKKLQDKTEKEYDKYVTKTTDRGDTPVSKREWARKILKSKTVEESTEIKRLTLSIYINKILTEDSKTRPIMANKDFPEMDSVAEKIAKDTYKKIKEESESIETIFPYKEGYVLEKVTNILKSKQAGIYIRKQEK